MCHTILPFLLSGMLYIIRGNHCEKKLDNNKGIIGLTTSWSLSRIICLLVVKLCMCYTISFMWWSAQHGDSQQTHYNDNDNNQGSFYWQYFAGDSDSLKILFCPTSHTNMCKVLYWSGDHKLNGSKINFPSNFNCDEKIISKMGRGPHFLPIACYRIKQHHPLSWQPLCSRHPERMERRAHQMRLHGIFAIGNTTLNTQMPIGWPGYSLKL